MQIVRLEIERFRSIRSAVLFPGKHNVYLGPNNIGLSKTKQRKKDASASDSSRSATFAVPCRLRIAAPRLLTADSVAHLAPFVKRIFSGTGLSRYRPAIYACFASKNEPYQSFLLSTSCLYASVPCIFGNVPRSCVLLFGVVRRSERSERSRTTPPAARSFVPWPSRS